MSEYSDLILDSFPNAYWRCGSTADSSGNANTLTLNAGLTTTPQLIREETDQLALFFDGTDDYATAADSATLDVGDTFSIEFWIRSDGTVFNDYLIDKGTDGYQVRMALNKINFAKGGGAVMCSSSITLQAGHVYHVVVTKSGSTSAMYIDGVDRTDPGTNATIVDNATALHIGRNANSSADFFVGTLDEIAIYPTALSAETIRAHYSAGASLVPDKYDAVINGQGYMCADLEEIKAQYGYTPTFVPRSNTQGDYGDNFQDFWMRVTQRDWQLGQGQRYFRAGDQRSSSRYWDGDTVEHGRDGEVKIGRARITMTFGEAVAAYAEHGVFSPGYAAGNTKLFSFALDDGTVTDLGAHGAGGVGPGNGKWTVCVDTHDVYIAGSGDLRRWTSTPAFSTFNAEQYDALAFLNNSLYGIQGGTPGSLVRFSTAGVVSTLFTWQDAVGAGYHVNNVWHQLCAWGGKLLINRVYGERGLSSLWVYDGIGTSMLTEFPSNFSSHHICVVNGVVYIGGISYQGATLEAQVWYYVNGQSGILWRGQPTASATTGASNPMIPVSGFGGVVWADEVRGRMLHYNPETGGVRDVGSFTPESNLYVQLGGTAFGVGMLRNSTTGYLWGAGVATSASIKTSLFDFDSSLTKIMRGIKLEFDAGSDGDGGSVNIAYRIGDVDGAYTNLQTGAVSGTEYLLTGVNGRSISVQITLNKGTSTFGPTLKQVSVRALPQQPAFRKGTLVIACWGRDGESPLTLRDGSNEPKDGQTLAALLNTAATATTPIAITDQFGTLSSAVIDAEGYQLRQIRPNEFIAVVPYREV